MTLEETKEFLYREQRKSDLKAVMATQEGRRFIWRVIGEAGVFRSSFVSGSSDITSFNEGSRNNGLTLLSEIMSDLPESFLIMQKEALDNVQTSKKEAGGNLGNGGSDDNGGIGRE